MTHEMTHEQDIESLLPWYVNGTLEGEELQRVQSAIAASPELQQEVEFLSSVRSQVKQATSLQSPGELGLKRLQRELNKTESSTKASGNWWRPAAIAAGLLLAVQTAVIQSPNDQNTGIEPLSGGIQVQQQGIVVQIGFNPSATMADIQALLMQSGASIISGPSAVGIYRIQFEGLLDQAIAEQRREQLLASTVVEFAEFEAE